MPCGQETAIAKRSVIQGIGHGLPARIVTNEELETRVDTKSDWIIQRTGIRERRVSSDEESTGTFALAAARQALERAQVPPQELDLIIVGTVTGDYIWPSTACFVQNELRATKAGAFDLSAACAGFVYGLACADGMIKSGTIKTALVIGADCFTKILDWDDRGTCVLFGDAAGAVVLRGEEDSNRGLIDTVMLSDGSGIPNLIMEAGGSKYPYGAPHSEGKSQFVKMAGSEVYRFAVGAMGDACRQVLQKAGMTVEDVDIFVPHQANIRIIESAATKLGLPPEKVFVNVDRYGNTSAGSIPLALYEAEEAGKLKKGMVVLTVGFGAGLVWGANLIRW